MSPCFVGSKSHGFHSQDAGRDAAAVTQFSFSLLSRPGHHTSSQSTIFNIVGSENSFTDMPRDFSSRWFPDLLKLTALIMSLTCETNYLMYIILILLPLSLYLSVLWPLVCAFTVAHSRLCWMNTDSYFFLFSPKLLIYLTSPQSAHHISHFWTSILSFKTQGGNSKYL